MVLNDRQIKVREIAEALDISKERVCHILNAELDMRKLSARWNQKKIRMNICMQLLEQFQRNEQDIEVKRSVVVGRVVGVVPGIRHLVAEPPIDSFVEMRRFYVQLREADNRSKQQDQRRK